MAKKSQTKNKMIKTSKRISTVEFAKTDLCSIVISVTDNSLILNNVDPKHKLKVSEKATEKQKFAFPAIELIFHKEESIDELIKSLEVLKQNLKFNPFTNAC